MEENFGRLVISCLVVWRLDLRKVSHVVNIAWRKLIRRDLVLL